LGYLRTYFNPVGRAEIFARTLLADRSESSDVAFIGGAGHIYDTAKAHIPGFAGMSRRSKTQRQQARILHGAHAWIGRLIRTRVGALLQPDVQAWLPGCWGCRLGNGGFSFCPRIFVEVVGSLTMRGARAFSRARERLLQPAQSAPEVLASPEFRAAPWNI